MKNMKWLVGAWLMACGMILMPACSDDDNNVEAPVFPEKVEEISLESPGEKAALAFSANAEWTLTSSKLWCQFVSEGGNKPMLVGAPGEQQVELVITDDIWDFETATAEVSLNMAGVSKVVAKVSRAPRSIQIVGYDEEHPFKISYSAGLGESSATLELDVNFDWELNKEGIPEWLEIKDLPLKGYAGRKAEIKMEVKAEAKVSKQEGRFTFLQQKTGKACSFPVLFSGMGAEDFETSLTPVWNWTVSKDGTQYAAGSITEDNPTEMNDFPLNIQVAAKDNQYKVVRLVKGQYGLVEPDPWSGNEFFKVEDDGKGHLTIPAFDENSKQEREGYILVFPIEVYKNKLQENVENALDNDYTEINSEYEQYIIWNFKQEGVGQEASTFEVKAFGYLPLECLPGDGGTGLGEVITGNTGVMSENIYHVKVTPETYLQINPKLSLTQWNPGEMGMSGMTIMNMQGEDFSDAWYPSMNSAEEFVVEGTANETMMVAFPDYSMGFPMPAKALLIIVEPGE